MIGKSCGMIACTAMNGELRSSRKAAWARATVGVIALWLIAVSMQMIADVWDETNGMLFFSSPAMSLTAKLHFVLTQSLGFWRPLPTLAVAALLHFVPDFEVSWRLLRAVNIIALIAALYLLLSAINNFHGRRTIRSWDGPLAIATTVAFLWSGSALITAGWYANIFDVAALLLVMGGIRLLSDGRPLTAGVLLGIAFFCKETAVLAAPALLTLLLAGHIKGRALVRTAIPALVLGATYFWIRSRIIPFGTESDVHQFAANQFWPTIRNLAESFWRQNLKGAGGIFGFAWLLLSFAALRRWKVMAGAIVLFAATVVIYWGMFGEYQDGILMHHLNFVGRLYLMPAALFLLVLGAERKKIAIALLCVPIVAGAYTTYRDHRRFQNAYRKIYAAAHDSSAHPTTVNYPTKPLDDTVRGITVGNLPGAMIEIDSRDGRLVLTPRYQPASAQTR